MSELFDQLRDENVPAMNELRALICEACKEEAGKDEVKSRDLQRKIVNMFADALLLTCSKDLKYDPKFIATYISAPRALP